MKVAIIHPWFPQYRETFFRQLVERANRSGIEVKIFHGDTPRRWNARSDSLVDPQFTRLRTRFFRVRGRDLSLKSMKPLKESGPYDLIVVEQAVRNLETYRLLFNRQGAALAFWGHGRTYTTAVSQIQERTKEALTRQGSWFFSYTEGGADAVAAAGFPRDRISVVQNSIDTELLAAAVNAVTEAELKLFQETNDLHGKTALFVGGLDEPKRLPFLLESGKLAHDEDQDFRLLIAGNGDQRHLIEEEAGRFDWVKYLGTAFGAEKARALAAADLLMMPGRVGLVIVDGFAAGMPIVTTDWEWHAPEFEYLKDGVNGVVTENSTEAYAHSVVALLNDPDRLARLSEACRADASTYTVSAMVENFASGLERALGVNGGGTAE